MARVRIRNVAEVAAPGPEGLTGLRAQWAGERPARSQRGSAAPTPPSDPAAEQSPEAAARRQPLIERMSSERWRMASSLLLSLLLHGSLLSLTFGGQGLGLPGLKFPWQERRIEVPELRVVLVPAPLTPAEPAVKSIAGPAQQASIAPPVASGRARTPPASPAPPLRRATLEVVPLAKPKAEAKPERKTPWPPPLPQRRRYAPVSPVTQWPRRSLSRPRSTWRRPPGPSGSCLSLPRRQRL